MQLLNWSNLTKAKFEKKKFTCPEWMVGGVRWGEGGGSSRRGKVRELGLVHKLKKFVLKKIKQKIQLLCDGLRE